VPFGYVVTFTVTFGLVEFPTHTPPTPHTFPHTRWFVCFIYGLPFGLDYWFILACHGLHTPHVYLLHTHTTAYTRALLHAHIVHILHYTRLPVWLRFGLLVYVYTRFPATFHTAHHALALYRTLPRCSTAPRCALLRAPHAARCLHAAGLNTSACAALPRITAGPTVWFAAHCTHACCRTLPHTAALYLATYSFGWLGYPALSHRFLPLLVYHTHYHTTTLHPTGLHTHIPHTTHTGLHTVATLHTPTLVYFGSTRLRTSYGSTGWLTFTLLPAVTYRLTLRTTGNSPARRALASR